MDEKVLQMKNVQGKITVAYKGYTDRISTIQEAIVNINRKMIGAGRTTLDERIALIRTILEMT